jgi:hypothetical protein
MRRKRKKRKTLRTPESSILKTRTRLRRPSCRSR